MDVISHPAFAHLHPTGTHVHPETQLRLARLHERFPDYQHGVAASREQIERVHDAAYVGAIGEIVEATATDPGVLADIPAWARSTGQELISLDKLENKEFRFIVKRLLSRGFDDGLKNNRERSID